MDYTYIPKYNLFASHNVTFMNFFTLDNELVS